MWFHICSFWVLLAAALALLLARARVVIGCLAGMDLLIVCVRAALTIILPGVGDLSSIPSLYKGVL